MVLNEIRKIIIGDRYYYSLGDFLKKPRGQKRAVTSVMDKIPESEVFKMRDRGRGSAVYVTLDGIKSMVSKMPRFPIKIKEELGMYEVSCSEAEFIFIIGSFLDRIKVEYETQYKIDIYNVDLYIPSIKLAVEFDEYGHDQQKDTERSAKILEKCNDMLRCDSRTNVGTHIGSIYSYLHS